MEKALQTCFAEPFFYMSEVFCKKVFKNFVGCGKSITFAPAIERDSPRKRFLMRK